MLNTNKLATIELTDAVIIKRVALRVRTARLAAALSQERCGELCGVTFQQWQKYEKGTNRIGPEKLARFARAVGRPVGFFYEDVIDASEERAGLVEALASDPAFHQLAGLFHAIDAARRPAFLRSLRAFNDLVADMGRAA